MANCGDPLVLHGGTVQHHPRVYLIFWGPNWRNNSALDSEAQTLANSVFGRLRGSAFNNLLTQYYDAGGNVANDTVLAGYDEDSTAVPDSFGDAEVEAEIDLEVSRKSWSATDDTQFIVIPQPGTNTSGASGCGRHFMRLPGATGTAAFALNPSDMVGCSIYSLTSIALHEYAEAVTDPQGLDWELAPSNVHGWSTYNPGLDPIEVADKCAGDGRQTDQYFNVDQPMLWSPAANGCTNALGQDFPTTDPGWAFHTVQGGILNLYLANSGFYRQWLGAPLTEQMNISPGGHVSYFQGLNYCGGGATFDGVQSGSAIYAGPTGYFEVDGCIYHQYSTLGETHSGLGFPVSNVVSLSGGYASYFAGYPCNQAGPRGENSAIYSGGPGTFVVRGCAYQTYRTNGETSVLGFPTANEFSDASGWHQYFQNGRIDNGVVSYYNCPAGLYSSGSIDQNILNAYHGDGGRSTLGCPVDNGGGVYVHYWGGPGANVQDFAGGSVGPAVMVEGPQGTYFVNAGFRNSYINGGANSTCKAPINNAYGTSNGTRQDFVGCYMTWTSAGGVVVHTPPNPATCTDYGGTAVTGPNACVGFYTTSTWFAGGGVGLFGQEIWTYANGTVAQSTANYTLHGLDNTRAYTLQAYIPNNNSNASNAHYHFCGTNRGCADGYVNQNNFADAWATFGTVCTTDGNATITLADDGGDNYPVRIGADAIRAVHTGIAC